MITADHRFDYYPNILRAISMGLCIFVACEKCMPAMPQEAAPSHSSEASDARKIDQLIRQLGADSYSIRRQAFTQLWEQGPAVKERLDQAASSSDKEIANSARRLKLLNKIRPDSSDIQTAFELAEIFKSANQAGLVGLAERGHWKAAELYLDEYPALEVRGQENFYEDSSTLYLIQQLVTLAMHQGDAKLAWPVVSRLMPTALAAWTAHHVDLSLDGPGDDDYVRAVRLLMVGKVDQALSLDLPAQLKLRLVTRGFYWDLLREPALENALLGPQPSISRQAAQAVLVEMAGDIQSADAQWQALLKTDKTGIEDEANSLKERETRAAVELLQSIANAPLDTSSLDQLLLALVVSGRVEPVEKFLETHSPPVAFDLYTSTSNPSSALRQVGLELDLSNFDDWLDDCRTKMRNELMVRRQQNQQGQAGLETALQLGEVGSMLAGLGHREQSMQILMQLVDAGQRGQRSDDGWMQPNSTRRQFAIWDWCILRWLGRELWRDCCLEVVVQHYDLLPKAHRSTIFAKLFPSLDNYAWPLWIEAPNDAPDAPQAIRFMSAVEYLDALDRCDKTPLGSDVQTTLKAWFLRVMRHSDEDESEYPSGPPVHLAQIAHQMGYSNLALELLAMDSMPPSNRRESREFAASILLDMLDPESALRCLEGIPPFSPRQDLSLANRLEARTIMGQHDKAQQEYLAHWMAVPNFATSEDPMMAYRTIEDLCDQHRWDEALPLAHRNFQTNSVMTYFNTWEAQQYSRILHELNRPQESADVMRCIFVELLRPHSQPLAQIVRMEQLGLLRLMAANERMYRAITLIEQGQHDAANHELAISFQLHPRNIEPVVECYSRWMKAGQAELADDLFDHYRSVLQKHLDQWPNDAMTLNNLAWMYSQCDRELDEALTLSENATRLSPRSSTYMDTLAEIHFRKGDSAKALELMRQCVRMDPRDPHYRENLLRFNNRPGRANERESSILP